MIAQFDSYWQGTRKNPNPLGVGVRQKIAATSRKAILGRRVVEQGNDCAAIVRKFGIGEPQNKNNFIEEWYWNKGIAFRYKNSDKVADITVFEPDQ